MYGYLVDFMVWVWFGFWFGVMGLGVVMGFFLCFFLYWVGSGGEIYVDKG